MTITRKYRNFQENFHVQVHANRNLLNYIKIKIKDN